MAVTTTIESTAQYTDSASNIGGCLNGGEDYKTLSANTKNIYGGILATRAWCGDNISDACKIISAKITFDRCTKSSSGGWIGLNGDCDFTFYGFERNSSLAGGGASGSNINSSLTKRKWASFSATASNSYKSATVEFKESDFTSNISESYRVANKFFPSVECVFWSGNALTTVRYYIKNFKISVTRTRACYISFNGEGISSKSVKYDYGSTPSYGSTPTRSGYTFKGWKSGSTTYSGTLPTAYEQDVTYTAVWEKNRVPCSITYNGNGATSGSVAAQNGYVGEAVTLAQNGFEKKYSATCDFNPNGYINNVLIATDTNYSRATFLGWYTAASGGTKVGDGGASYTPSGSVTLYAHWSAMSAITLPTPSRDGYTFLGWYTSAEGGTKVGDGAGNYTPSGNVTLYAHWKLNEINSIYIGTSQPKEIYIGTQKIKAVYVGTTKVYG